MRVEQLVAAMAGAGVAGGLALGAGGPVAVVLLMHLAGGALALGLATALPRARHDGAEAWLEPVPALVPRSASRR